MSAGTGLQELYDTFAAAHPGASMVFGSGDPGSGVLFVGEAPGRDEVKQGKAFVGPAGRNLSMFLELAGLAREDIYITNAVKYRLCRPGARPGTLVNRPAAKADITDNLPYLMKEIALISPEVIVTLGNVPLRAVCGGKLPPGGVGALHGRPFDAEVGGAVRTVFPMYHPAGIIYDRSLLAECEKDFTALGQYLAAHKKRRASWT